jgi:hypothetical protein
MRGIPFLKDLSRKERIFVLFTSILSLVALTILLSNELIVQGGVAVGGIEEIRPGEYSNFGATDYTLEQSPVFWLTLDNSGDVPDIDEKTKVMAKYGPYYKNYYARQDESSLVLCPKLFDDFLQSKFPAITTSYSATRAYFNYSYGSKGSNSTYVSKKEADLKRIIRLGKSGSDKEPSYFDKGIYYNNIKNYFEEQLAANKSMDKIVKELSNNNKWKTVFDVNESSESTKCYEVWSYMTQIKDGDLDLTSKINTYTKAGQIDWSVETIRSISNDPVKADMARSEYYGYIDFLITLYVLSAGSGAEQSWEDAVSGYIVWAYNPTDVGYRNKFNISITAGGGYMINEDGNPQIYVINPIQAVMASMGINTANDFSAE